MIACSLVFALDDTLADGEPETFGVTMGDAQWLVDGLANSLAEMETVTVGYTVNDVEA